MTVSGTYEVGQQDQAFLGPESGIAIPDGAGGVDIHVATQWLHVDRDQVAPCLGLEPEQVRIHLAGVGGAFGGREDLSMQIHAAMLALHANRPVKMVYDREESFVGHVHRHPARIRAEHRATKAGKLVAVRMRHPHRRGRVRLQLDRRDLERVRVRRRPVRGRQRPRRGPRRLHEQPAVRRDEGLRRGADLLRRGGPDGQARRGARHRPGGAPPPERPRARRDPRDRPGDHGVAADEGGDPTRGGTRDPGAGGAPARRDPAARWRRQHDAGRRRAPRGRLRGRVQEHLLLGGVRRLLHGARQALRLRTRRGALRCRRGRAGGLGGDPRGRPPGARSRTTSSSQTERPRASARPGPRRPPA